MAYIVIAGGWVYFLTNRPNGTLYIGVTSNLHRRMYEHRIGLGSVFVRRYNLHNLVYWERHDEIEIAIQREKTLKKWPRRWKVELIETINPDWRDLFDKLNV